MPPVAPMLAKSVAETTRRAQLVTSPSGTASARIVFRDGDEVEIGSRNERPMTRYFPEVVEAASSAELPERCVVDGEIVIADARQRPRLRGAAAADPPRRVPGAACWPRRRRPRSSPSTCSPWATTT